MQFTPPPEPTLEPTETAAPTVPPPPTQGGAQLLSLIYNQYDSFGNVSKLTDANTPYYFDYDAFNRLTCGYANAADDVTQPNPCTTRTGAPYSYDGNGRLTGYENGGVITYTTTPRHAVWKVATTQVASWGLNGNLTWRQPPGSTVRQTLLWDQENRLESVTRTSVTSANGVDSEKYQYDADGQRVKTTSDKVTYTPSPNNEESRVLCKGQTTPGNTNWIPYVTSDGLYVDVDTSACGLTDAPAYITSLGGSSEHFALTGGSSVYAASPTKFTVYIRFTSGAALSKAYANARSWHIN